MAADTAKDRVDPRIQQISFFLPNRLGALRRAFAALESKSLRIGGISTLDATDHAVVRVVVDKPETALQILTAEGYGACSTDVLGCALPPGPDYGVLRVLSVLVAGEVNVEYAYSLILRTPDGHPVLALQVDDLEMAGRVLGSHKFTLVGQNQLHWEERTP
jgi:hypothetical protein